MTSHACNKDPHLYDHDPVNSNLYTAVAVFSTPRLLLVGSEVTLGRDVDLLGRDRLVLSLLLGDESLSLQRGHATRSGRRDGLSVLLVLDVTGGEDTLDAGLGGSRDSSDVSILVEVELALDEGGGGLVTDGVEETVDLEVSGLLGLGVLEGEAGEELSVALALGSNGLVHQRLFEAQGKRFGHSRSREQ